MLKPISFSNHVEAERSLLSAIFLDPERYFRSETTKVGPDDFIVEAHRIIYSEMLATLDEGRPCKDVMVIATRLQERGLLEHAGGVETLVEILESQFHGFHINDYATTVRSNSTRRRIAVKCNDVAAAACDGRSPDELLGELDDLATNCGGAGANFELQVMTSREFSATDFKQEYVINGVLAGGQPAVLGGPQKALKTGILADLAISLGTATPFLSQEQFFVPKRCRVCVLSGESGGAKLQATAKAICESRNLRLEDADVLWGLDLPHFADPNHLRGVRRSIEKLGISVLIVDPAYLCLLAGDTRNRQAGNVFDMGALLLEVGQLGQRTGCTIMLAHHTRKLDEKRRFLPTTLDDLSQSGFREFARQWILIGRRCEYSGDGKHSLWLNIGGSAGHFGEYVLHVDEGQIAESLERMTWECRLEKVSVANARAQDEKERRKQEIENDRRLAKLEKLGNAARRHPQGETKTVLREEARLNATDAISLLNELIERGAIEECTVTKNGKSHPGYRPIPDCLPSTPKSGDGTTRSQAELRLVLTGAAG